MKFDNNEFFKFPWFVIGMSPKTIEILLDNYYDDIRKIASSNHEQLMKDCNLTEKRSKNIIKAAKDAIGKNEKEWKETYNIFKMIKEDSSL